MRLIPTRAIWQIASLFWICLLSSFCSPAHAQYVAFGKNKVHYSDFDWHVLKSDHFDVYSAGIETHGLNPRAIEVTGEEGVDISGQRSELINE